MALRRKETQPSSATSERMGFWDLDDHNTHPVRVSYLHLAQPPRLVSRRVDNIHSGLFQLVSYSVDVSHLQPQTYTLVGSSILPQDGGSSRYKGLFRDDVVTPARFGYLRREPLAWCKER